MAETEVQLRDAQLTSILEKARGLLQGYDASDRKEADMAELKSLLKSYENAFDNYKIECRELPKKDQRLYKKKRKEYTDALQELQNDIRWKAAQSQKNELLDGQFEEEVDRTTEIGKIKYGQSVLAESKDSLQRTLGKVTETVTLGAETLQKLENQTKQLENMHDSMDELGSSLERSQVIMRRMFRKMSTDKYLWVVTFFVFAAVVAIVVYQALPDDLKKKGKHL
eukprot:gb/GEZN01012431.1/.p1 GENE.gb/GEZN01012431.1/~~gb/GEZN01012431.1/.p1  ORF type:complete len:225 (+),score=57.85 gb/GEZN01012431.1/:106-780(+)